MQRGLRVSPACRGDVPAAIGQARHPMATERTWLRKHFEVVSGPLPAVPDA